MKVKDIMTSNSLKYCTPETKLCDAGELMKISNLGALPVIDTSQRVIGLVTNHDVQISLTKFPGKLFPLLVVKEIMINKVHTLNSNDKISSAARHMMKNKIGRALVVDENGKLEGVVSLFKLISNVNTISRSKKGILNVNRAMAEESFQEML